MSASLHARPGDITDDPIGPVPTAPRPEKSGALSTIGCVFGAAALLALAIGAMIAIADGESAIAAGLFAIPAVPSVLWAALNPRRRLLRALRRHPAKLSFGLYTRPQRTELHLHLGRFAGELASPFDPATQGEAMRTVWRCRVRDCAVFEPRLEPGADPRRTGRVWVPVDVVAEGEHATRVADWHGLVRYLAARPDPEGAWLAAIACVEDHRWTRAHAALRQLADRDDRRPLYDRVCAWLTDEGPFPARVAAAIERADITRMDRLLADPSAASDALIALLDARWRAAPDDDALARWRADERLAWVLARMLLPDTTQEHWRRLVAHPRLDIALTAADTAMADGPPLALPIARAMLDRDDLRARVDGLPADLRAVVERALDHLGHIGEVEDLRRLGGWSSAPGDIGAFAERQRIQLKGLVEHPETAGGLALATAEGARGGLSEAAEEP